MTRRQTIWMTGTALAAGTISIGVVCGGRQTRMSSGLSVAHDRDLPTPSAVTGITWSSDGGVLAAASYYGQYVTVWNGSGLRLGRIQRIGGGPYPFNSIALLRGGTQLLFPPGDDGGDRIALDLWDLKSATITKQIEGPAPDGDYARNNACYFDVSSNNYRVIGAPFVGKTFAIWRTDSWTTERVGIIPNGVAAVKFFPDGYRAVVGSYRGTWSIVDPKGDNTVTYTAYDAKYASSIMSAVAVDPTGKLVATGRGLISLEGAYAQSADIRAMVEHEPAIKIWRVGDDAPNRIISGLATPVRALAWDPLGRYLAVVDAAKNLTLIEPSDLRASTVLELPDETSALAIHPDGHALAVGTGAGVRLFRIV